MKQQEDAHRAKLLLRKYKAGICTPEEEKIVLQWFYSFDENETNFPDESLAPKVNEKLDHILFSKQKKSSLTYWLPISAAAAVIFFFLWNNNTFTSHSTQSANEIAVEDIPPGSSTAKITYSDGFSQLDSSTLFSHQSVDDKYASQQILVEVPKAAEYQILLADGTKVWLNSQSKLSYPVTFDNQNRIVQLEGEAYFEVAKDPNRPFLIHSKKNVIEVIGTSFNVNAYHDKVSTSLVEGAVKILFAGEEKYLKPGQEAISSDESIAIQQADLKESTAWHRGEFYFDQNNLDEIIQQISRWYNVEFELLDLSQIHITYKGSINRNQELSKVLEILSLVTNKKYRIQERKIIVQN